MYISVFFEERLIEGPCSDLRIKFETAPLDSTEWFSAKGSPEELSTCEQQWSCDPNIGCPNRPSQTTDAHFHAVYLWYVSFNISRFNIFVTCFIYILKKKTPLPFCSYMLLLDPWFCRSWTARFGGSCAVLSRQQKGVLHLLPALSWSDAKQAHTQTDRQTHAYIYIIKSCHWHIDMWFSRAPLRDSWYLETIPTGGCLRFPWHFHRVSILARSNLWLGHQKCQYPLVN